uniref:peptidyl-glycine alpha-amidating monooxygenase B isoform X1 n=1 Tax=Oncorhynchus gorbuscha TaxID=8017 RepID=UPI001EAE872D|nr:peptidyl-glycine alpha-amidating monooxygenase B isoform X1 [Oncorhynchus gorbuscha]XP_046146538.1 peptidyl-glycine alpha-amidating monooxygenase B isoform X1 [Oncorhynchus gorbuscha]
MGVLVCGVVVLTLICQSHSLDGATNPLHRFKRYQESASSEPNDCTTRTRQPMVLSKSGNFSLDVRMPGVSPTVSDTYLCVAVPVPTTRDAYIVDFEPHASMDTAHHMLLYGCGTPVSTTNYWDCGSVKGTCEDEASIMYAWARNAPPTRLPPDVGFKVGGKSRITYFVLQIHYGDVHAFSDHHRDCSGLTLRMTSKPQPFIAGMYLMMSVTTVILPGNKVTNADVACTYNSYPIYPFAFRTHTHKLGQVVSGYRIRDGKWTLIGRQTPQLPQAFYPATEGINVKYGDTLAARCVFTGEGRTTNTYIGGTSDDEMCNFYMMYYMESRHAAPFQECMEDGSKELFQNIPPEANVPITVPPEMMMHNMMHSAGAPSTPEHQDDMALLQPKREEEEVLDQGDFYSLLSKLLGESEDVVHVHKYTPGEAQSAQAKLVAQIDSIIQKKDLGWPSPRLGFLDREDAILVRDRVHKFHQLEATARPPGSKLMPANALVEIDDDDEEEEYHLEEVTDWPESPLQLGQVSGLALDSDDNLVIFHRGDHQWGVNSFDNSGKYQQQSLGPIQQSTILVVDPVKGSVLKASGRNMFYLPHGITTDKDNNYWVTDVALHQVFKLSSDGRDKPLVVLGEAFEPGSDKEHFCKPTDVAVDPVTGNVYVSDGYCNARILKFSPEGKYLSHWGAGSSDRRRRVQFRIPHSLVFLPDRRELCVADRENGRIQCFVAESGEFVKEIKKQEFGGEVFAISYAPVHGGLIYAVNGESAYGRSAPLKGFVINYSTKEILDDFSPENTQEFGMPHDIVVTKDGRVFVGDAATDSVLKFSSDKAEHRSVKKGGIEVQEIEETETIIQTRLKPQHRVEVAVAKVQIPVATQQKTAEPVQEQPQKTQQQEDDKDKTLAKQTAQGVSPAVITTLLLIPLVVVISIGVLIRYRKNRMYGDGCEVKLEQTSSGGILGKLRGKAAGGLNLGNFFATHKGYTRQGFDRLSTEGSDQEKDDDNDTDSENEEYSAPPPPVGPSSSS